MDQKNLCSLMEHAFKSLAPISIEILEKEGRVLTVRTVSESYAELSFSERVEKLVALLFQHSPLVTKQFIIAFHPYTSSEFSQEFEGDPKNIDEAWFEKIYGQGAKEVHIN